MKYQDLDGKQKEVITAVLKQDCKILVLGGAGTGKTTVALWCAKELLEKSSDVPNPRVLFLTFSRSAVGQITKRSPGVISESENNVEITTFHALAYRLLQSFGRYAGFGTEHPVIQSNARIKLLGPASGQLTYNDLIPAALRVLDNVRIRKLISSRWTLVISDEVQDTNMEQWELLQILSPPKLLLLGDANQMIYTFIPGVSPERFAEICDSVDETIELHPVSHRDPSGAIPALAEAIRERHFDDAAVTAVLRSGRLKVISVSEESEVQTLIVKQIQNNKNKEIGIFAHSNAAVAGIADDLSENGIEHVLVGIPEAHAEALNAMSIQCGYAVGLSTAEDLRTALAIFITATVRGNRAPELAQSLIGKSPLPDEIEEAISQLESSLVSTTNGTINDIASIAMHSWQGLRITTGTKSWQRAVGHFRRLIYTYRNNEVSTMTVGQIMKSVEQNRVEALIDLNYSERGRVRLMNYHQTKGREADIVVHIFRDDDYFGSQQEPFEELSRLLNVALSRAREQVIIILPPNPHPLVKPFEGLI